ncbi:MAG: hypothetical protein HC880_17660 [Bacteroidia bacterium]|nr:hypothetical protein [Bacteroidia bacterium]
MILDYVSDENKKEFKECFQAAVQGEKVLVEMLVNFNKRAYWYDMQYLPVYYNDGEIFAVAVSFLEITQKKQVEARLKQQNKQLEEYAFITSHNLRRPLANILGLISLFNVEKLDDIFNREIIQNLQICARELDQVIHQTNAILEENSLNS